MLLNCLWTGRASLLGKRRANRWNGAELRRIQATTAAATAGATRTFDDSRAKSRNGAEGFEAQHTGRITRQTQTTPAATSAARTTATTAAAHGFS